jgi:hypothetical protein
MDKVRPPPPKNTTQWPESASELYRPSDHRLLAKLVPTFADRGCRVVSVTDYSRLSIPEPLLFLSSCFSVVLTRLSGLPFQAYYFWEYLVAPGIDPGPLDVQELWPLNRRGGQSTNPAIRNICTAWQFLCRFLETEQWRERARFSWRCHSLWLRCRCEPLLPPSDCKNTRHVRGLLRFHGNSSPVSCAPKC